MKYLAVLLTVFNRKIQTLSCLDRLYKQIMPEGVKMHVYLTNDGCTDGTPEAIRQQFPDVKTIDGDGTLFWNRGMWTAWNKAIHTDPETQRSLHPFEKAKYDWYLWLNDDTDIYEDCVLNLLNASMTMGDNAIVVGSTKPHGDSEHISYGGRDRSRKRVIPDEKECREIYIMNGNIVLIPRYVYEIVGTNDPVFSHAFGDYDYGLRAGKLGIKLVIAPGVLGECDNHTQLPAWCNPDVPFKKRWKLFGTPRGIQPKQMFIYQKRHEGLTAAIKAFVGNYLRVMFPQLWHKKVYSGSVPKFG